MAMKLVSPSHNEMLGVIQKTVFAIGEITTDLFHPRGIRTRRDASDLHASCLQVHDGEHIERDQSVSRPHLDRREIRGEDRIPVCLEER